MPMRRHGRWQLPDLGRFRGGESPKTPAQAGGPGTMFSNSIRGPYRPWIPACAGISGPSGGTKMIPYSAPSKPHGTMSGSSVNQNAEDPCAGRGPGTMFSNSIRGPYRPWIPACAGISGPSGGTKMIPYSAPSKPRGTMSGSSVNQNAEDPCAGRGPGTMFSNSIRGPYRPWIPACAGIGGPSGGTKMIPYSATSKPHWFCSMVSCLVIRLAFCL